VVQVLAGTVRLLREKLPKNINLELAPLSKSFTSFVDEEKLRSMLLELASNAVVAMNGKGSLRFETVEISVDAENELGLRAGSYLRIAVSDDGKGMEPDIAARALDPLFSTRSSHINVGWGLSNCAGFARQSGGAMHLRTAAGNGTSVEIYIPGLPG
jgi:signal transduction histidine kinase